MAGGTPDIVADISACSLCEDNGACLVSAVDEYTEMAQHDDDAALHINTFTAPAMACRCRWCPRPATAFACKIRGL
ncbi:hypothetical protein CYMTET_26152 [Cymbomonas tetramitiformis]|uniref:Uncharacterized protein n=1 Tax=Cymbomonas tetramitiformis TaxID=36881 RepID=A0AAE0FSC6_9CHLO|nr:hypothetical protein CYMTET_26152 [Cymbomonas tetramitiformis]